MTKKVLAQVGIDTSIEMTGTKSQSQYQPQPQDEVEAALGAEPLNSSEGAWEPVSNRGSMSSEVESGNFSAIEGTEGSVVMPTSSEGEYDGEEIHNDDHDEDIDSEESGREGGNPSDGNSNGKQ